MTVEFDIEGPGNMEKGSFGAGLRLLAGAPTEALAAGVDHFARDGDLGIWTGQGAMAGMARVTTEGGVERAAQRVYGQVIRAAAGLHLHRLWNFVPGINEDGVEGLENYRAFCRGRSVAFEAAFGRDFARVLPAASAVGTARGELTVIFLGGAEAPLHFENPVQVPAYLYPAAHGPRPPSFARATVVPRAGRVDAFISGTSAVVGHETIAPGDTAGQVECTLKNLHRISEASGLGEHLACSPAGRRHFKVFLRSERDLELVSSAMGRSGFLSAGDLVSYLRADICRAALNVEVEVAVRGAARN
jgi:enamine deaminase RidA (YjgF/YER057c/UK114 family)